MTKKEKFEVSVAAFEALLGKNNLWQEYMMNFNHYRLKGTSQDIYSDWKAWASFTPLYQWSYGAFIWDDTEQEHSIWRDFNSSWLRWICNNLNK